MSLLLALVIVLAQALTGAFWWRVVRGPSVRMLECAGVGLALGTAASALSGVLLFGIVPAGWAWSAPTLATAVVALVTAPRWLPRRSGRRLFRPTAWPAAAVGLAVGLGLGAASLLVNLRNYPLDAPGMTTTYHPDMLFFEAVSTSLARLGSADSIFMAGAELRYHWLTYAWAGQVAESAGTGPFVILTRVLPIVALIGAVLIAVAWTQRLTRGAWAPTVAATLVVAGGYVGATYGTILNFDSPSQSLSTMWTMALCLALLGSVTRWAGQHRRLVGLIIVVLVLSAGTTAGKVTSAAVVLAGWGLVAIVMIVRRDARWRRAVTALAALITGFAAVYLAWLTGSAESGGLGLGSLLDKASSVQGLNPTDQPWGIVLGTILLALAVLPRWAGVLWLVASPRSRWAPLTMLSVGMGAAGIGALLMFSGGMNDTWFALGASAPLAVASAAGASRAVRRTLPARGQWRPAPRVLAAIGAGVLLAGIVGLLWTFGPDGSPSLRWTAPIVAVLGAVLIAVVLARPATGSRRATMLALTIVVLITMACLGRLLGIASERFAVQPGTGLQPTEFAPREPFTTAYDQNPVTTWSAAQASVARQLADSAAPGDLVATNIAFSPLVPALSGQPMYIAAIQYQAPYGRPDAIDDLLARERATWDFVDAPSPATAQTLCDAGVRWVWVEPTRTTVRDWSPYASIERLEEDVILLRLDVGACD